VRRAPGKLANLEAVCASIPSKALRHRPHPLGHPWTPHEENAHPTATVRPIVVVHNGIVENYLQLKRELIAQHHKFVTKPTLKYRPPHRQVQRSGSRWRRNPSGSSPFAAPSSDSLEVRAGRSLDRAGTRSSLPIGPPVVIGVGEANLRRLRRPAFSTTPATLLPGDGDMAILTWPASNSPTSTATPSTAISQEFRGSHQAEKGGYKHFMLKESGSSPGAITDTRWARLARLRQGLPGRDEDLRRGAGAGSSIKSARCGTSWHSALTGKYMMSAGGAARRCGLCQRISLRQPHPDPIALGLLITNRRNRDTLAAQREMIGARSKTVPSATWWTPW